MMNDIFRLEIGKGFFDSVSISDISFEKARSAVEVFLISGGQIVHDCHFMSLGQGRVHDVRTDETGTTGHQDS